MKLKSLFFLFSLSSLLFLGLGCTKVEGPGGAATIKGVIHIEEYDGANNLINEYDAQKSDVFIIYGNDPENTYFNDDIETSYDGTFEFTFLEKGNYRVFVYEDCNDDQAPTCYSGKVVTTLNIEITDKKEVVQMDTIFVRKNI